MADLLIWNIIFSMFGLGFFMYGRSMEMLVPKVCGVLLMVVPYFIPDAVILIIVGVVLSVIPFVVKH
ncbi:MAG: amino acid transport protein [Gammaproteobacteria bacterium]